MGIIDFAIGIKYLIDLRFLRVLDIKDNQAKFACCEVSISSGKVNAMHIRNVNLTDGFRLGKICNIQNFNAFFISNKCVAELNRNSFGLLKPFVINHAGDYWFSRIFA